VSIGDGTTRATGATMKIIAIAAILLGVVVAFQSGFFSKPRRGTKILETWERSSARSPMEEVIATGPRIEGKRCSRRFTVPAGATLDRGIQRGRGFPGFAPRYALTHVRACCAGRAAASGEIGARDGSTTWGRRECRTGQSRIARLAVWRWRGGRWC